MQLRLTEPRPSSELHCQNLYLGFRNHGELQQAHSPRWQFARKDGPGQGQQLLRQGPVGPCAKVTAEVGRVVRASMIGIFPYAIRFSVRFAYLRMPSLPMTSRYRSESHFFR